MEKLNHKIIPLSDIQFDAWFSLWHAYQVFYQAKIAQPISQNTWNKLIDAQQPQIYGFACIQNEQVVGIVHIIEHDSCWTIKPYAYLQDLYVDENYRNQGIARQLIEHVYQITQSRECDRVYWLTHESNETAQLLYDRVAKKTGFIQYRSP